LRTAVERLEADGVTLTTGETLSAKAVVIATDATEAERLTNGAVTSLGWRGCTTVYYASPQPVLNEPILCLDGDRSGPVNSVVELSAAAPSYAPAGQSLLSVAIISIPPDDDATLDRRVREQLTGWFGGAVNGWRLLRIDRIPHSLPDQTAGRLDPWQRPVRIRPGLYVCGDHRDNGSIDGAMTSGFRTAQSVMEDLHGSGRKT
jgi:hypothetical protein